MTSDISSKIIPRQLNNRFFISNQKKLRVAPLNGMQKQILSGVISF